MVRKTESGRERERDKPTYRWEKSKSTEANLTRMKEGSVSLYEKRATGGAAIGKWTAIRRANWLKLWRRNGL